MKLRQGQVWNQGDHYIRIVRLRRLEVEYKEIRDLATKEGLHHHVSKKEFCKRIRHATLFSPPKITEPEKSASTTPEANITPP